MNTLLLIGLIIFVFIGIPVGLWLILHYIPKKLGYPKTAKYLSNGFLLLVLVFVLYATFEDFLFSKNNAKELVEEQNLKLTDEFVLSDNESASLIGDYYHTFTLEISELDKENIISEIKNSGNFIAAGGPIEDLRFRKAPDRYFGEKITQNYETEESFVREYFEPSGREGYAPTFRRISINKSKKELSFEGY